MKIRGSTTSSPTNPRLRCETVPLALCLPSCPELSRSAYLLLPAAFASHQALNRNHLPGLHLVQVSYKDDARNIDRREQVGCKSECEGHGESLHRTRSKQEKDAGGNDRGHVRIEDRRPGMSKPLLHSHRGRFARAYLFADALKDQHVRIDAHTDGENHSGYSGQGQGCAGEAHKSEQNHEVEKQSEIRVDA